MKVIRERPCQRRHHRVTAPLWVERAGGDRRQAANWSLGDLRLDGVSAPLPPLGAEETLKLELPFQGFDIAFELKAQVARLEPEVGGVCYEYIELGERGRDLMAHFIQDLIRGKMATVADTICRIDVPVTPISTEPDPNPQEGTAVRRWPIKTIAMSALYLALGLFVFGYLGVLLYSNVARLEVTAAVVSTPLQTLKMPVDGVVHVAGLAEGDRVRRGDVLARIEDAALGAQIQKAELKAQAARDSLWRARQRFRIEKERLKLYRTISRTERDIARARVQAHEEALRAADAHAKRVRTLRQKGLKTQVELDEALRRQEAAAARLREHKLALQQATVMEAVSDRRHYNHKEFVVDLDLIEVELNALHGAYEAAAKQLKQLRALERRRAIRSPFDGRIVKILPAGGAAALRNDPIVTVEHARDLRVTAFLKQDEVLAVGLHDEASVFFPALNRSLTAEVVKIDRRSAFLSGDDARFSWRDADERTAAVALRFTDPAAAEAVEGGLPAVVIFQKRSVNDIYARIFQRDPPI